MLLTSFMTFLVLTSLKLNSMMGWNMMMNRLSMMTMSYMLMLTMMSMDMMSLMPGYTMYNNWFSLTSLNMPFMMMMLLLMMGLLMYNTGNNKYDMNRPYFTLMMLANLMGLLLFPLVNDLLALYVMMELQSYSLYLLTGLNNRSFNASRASLLYFLMGGVASAMILLALYFMYLTTGSTNMTDMMMYNEMLSMSYNTSYMFNNFDMLVMALLFKMGLAPLHRWSIAVYNYAPTYMTAYMSMVAKLSMMAWLYSNNMLYSNYMLIMFFYMSLFMGAYKPLFQMNIKTMLAYSGMLNFGYILLSLMSNDISLYIYILQYVLTHMMMFLIMLASSEYMNNPMSKWSPTLYMHQLKLPNLTLAFSLIMALFSLMGMPPLPGFYAKLSMLSGALSDNLILESLILIMCSVIATYYYANIIKLTMQSKTMMGQTMNPTLAYIMASCTLLLLSFFMFLPYISEGLYLIMM
uniref:NADH-ubiquinone oxidoreductase chain 2 n=1 Tax=Metschnikowia bicuspidata TaxID=27322 RepID=A0A896SPA4_9ASCO|nr:NADH dehydrogenase subunit 2 [Metschnikowia bicuspidata]QSD56437.1 NADH dehydrogenase subunit 2 [Metschnikowia bicuspidata]